MSRSALRRAGTAIGLALAAVLATSSTPAVAGTVQGTGATVFVASTVGAPPSLRALNAALPAGIHVTAVTPLAADLARITVRASLGASDAELIGDVLAATPKVATAAHASTVHIAGAIAPVRAGDEFFPRQWDLWDASSVTRAGGYGIDAPRAWQRTQGSPSVVVAVLDTGITGQTDLAGSHHVDGYDFVTGGDGIATGDGNGWDPDPSDPGDACTTGSPRTPSSWHGTFVTGEIAATHGSWGVAGEAPGVSIEPVRVLGQCGGDESDLIAAIEWASGGAVPGVPENEHPANVISLSLGAEAPDGCDGAMQQAVTDAWSRGTTVVVAAGNDDRPMATTAPADCDHVVSVAATTRHGNRADYSNYGTGAAKPTIAAPGGNDADPLLGDTWSATGSIDSTGNRSAIVGYMGTSMATPRVAAAAALLLSVSPKLSPDEVRDRLRASVTPFPSGSTCTVTRCGAGILNAGDLLGVTKRFVHATRATIGGTGRAGRLLSAHPGVFHPGATHLTYRWYRNGKALSATGAHYRVRAADRGALLTVKVTATRSGYRTAVVTSAARRIAR